MVDHTGKWTCVSGKGTFNKDTPCSIKSGELTLTLSGQGYAIENPEITCGNGAEEFSITMPTVIIPKIRENHFEYMNPSPVKMENINDLENMAFLKRISLSFSSDTDAIIHQEGIAKRGIPYSVEYKIAKA